jgi:hypothetical protein
MADKIIGPDDLELAKVYSYGEKSERQKRQLSPEMEQAIKDTSALGAIVRGASNSATFDQADRLAAKMGGGPIEDQWEMSQRIKEAHPWASLAGDVLGLGAQTALTGGASLIPRLAGAGLRTYSRPRGHQRRRPGARRQPDQDRRRPRRAQPREGARRGSRRRCPRRCRKPDPAALGHAPSIAASTRTTPLTAAERADLGAARQHAERFNFTGDAGLDLAQLARLSENPDMAGMAARMERIKANATPGTGTAQETAFQNAGLRDMLDRSVPQYGSPRGPSAGGLRKHPDLSGKEVGQNRDIFAGEYTS